jgi:apolipoprotein D and lipocalin family protein
MSAARLLNAIALLVAFNSAGAQEVQAVARVDLVRYSGTWFEIARLPNKFQAQCVANVSAVYVPRSDGQIEVINRCLKADGSTEAATGRGRIVDALSNAKLKVRFAPAWLSWLPSVWGDYWVLDLASDYSYAAVGEPGHKYLWILARNHNLSEGQYQEIVQRLAKQGYDTAGLVKTRHQP